MKNGPKHFMGMAVFALSLAFAGNAGAQILTGGYGAPPIRTGTHFSEDVSRFEAGIAGGGTLYQGDLVPKDASYQIGSFKDLRAFGSIFARYCITGGFSVRALLAIGRIDGDDRRFNTPEWRQRRAFSFTSPLQEFSVVAEYDFLRGLRNIGRKERSFPFGCYIFAGAGLVHTKPVRDFTKIDAGYFGPNDKAITGIADDRNAEASRTSFVIPLGIGLRWNATRTFSIFGEGGFRQTLTDKLDGFEHSVSSPDSDTYTMYSAGLIFRIPARIGKKGV